MLLGAIIPEVTAPYSSVDCIVAVSYQYFCLMSTCFLDFSILSMMTPWYFTDVHHGIFSPEDLEIPVWVVASIP